MAESASHGGGGDGHHGAPGLGVGLGADHGDAAAAVVPVLHVSPGQRRRLAAPQAAIRQDSDQSQVEAGALWAARSGRFEAAAAGLRGFGRR